MSDQIQILYVDDSETDVELMSLMFGEHPKTGNLALDSACTIEEGIRSFDVTKHQAVIIDWNLPDGSGSELAAHIRSLDADIPIIFLSGIFAPEQIQIAVAFAPKACLEKGWQSEHLEQLITHLT